MTKLASVVLNGKHVRHLVIRGRTFALCGANITMANVLSLAGAYAVTLCGNCDRTNARYTSDRVEPKVEAGATRRGSALADAGRVREVSGRIFRVAGSTDTYTIIIPSDRDLASTCTCMAAKTHPEIMCKHQSAVYLTIGGGA